MSSFVLPSLAKKRRYKSIEETAQKYSAFQSVEEMDAHIRSFVLTTGTALNETALKVLEMISRHSLKVIGVSWLSVPSLAKLVGVTDRTIRRALKRLEGLGIIKRIENLRDDGGRAANFIALQPVEQLVEADLVCDDVRGAVNEVVTHNLSNLLNLKNDDDIIHSHRENEFFNISKEWGIPKEAAQMIFPHIKDQLQTTSWIALEQSFSKLQQHVNTISSIPRWFAKTLETANLAHKISIANLNRHR